jgi:hypothetical protein
MGDRAYIEITSENFDSAIVLYGHWSGEDNLKAVKAVLEFTDRINDASYLVAQIFNKFAIEIGKYDGSLGYGISAITPDEGYYDWADNPVVFVNADNGNYSVGGDEWVNRWGMPVLGKNSTHTYDPAEHAE